jgi:hypothetical protein
MRGKEVDQFGELVEYEYETLACPPMIDDIVRCWKEKCLNASDPIKNTIDLLEKEPIQQFNFGPLNLETVREAQQEAIQFIQYGVFQLPYKCCMYRCTVRYDNKDVGLTMLLLDGRGQPNSHHGIACIHFIHSRDDMCAMHSINMLKTMLTAEGPAIEIQVPSAEIKFWSQHLLKPGVEFDANRTEVQQMTEGTLVAMGLTMILNTKGVYKERIPYATKPNAKRVKSGRPPLPYITRVSTALYNEAVRAGEPGTHASPRPHRRRAHLRHYPATPKREAYVLPIEAVLVNWDGQPMEERRGYEVQP